MVSATPRAADTASPYRKLTPRANMPRSAMHTMAPAKSTARPEVLTAFSIDDSSATYLYTVNRLMEFPIGVFAVAVSSRRFWARAFCSA